MRKIGIIIAILATGYFAGVYRNEPLMVMTVAEILLAAVMWLLSILLKKSLFVGFSANTGEAVLGDAFSCGVVIRNKGLLPISRFRLSLSSGYEGGSKTPEIVYGGILSGEQRLSVDVDCRHCGIARVSAEKVRVYDYLSMFSSQKNIGTSMMLTVYPKETAASISLAGLKEARQATLSGTVMTPYAGGNDEIRLLREYREGDSVRHVHWNLTARMDELWVREYDSERDVPLRFFIDLAGLGRAGTSKEDAVADRFFVVLESLLLGLLEDIGYIRIWWRGSDIFKGYGNEKDAFSQNLARSEAAAAVGTLASGESEEPLRDAASVMNTAASVTNTSASVTNTAASVTNTAASDMNTSASFMNTAAKLDAPLSMDASAMDMSAMDIRSRDDCRELLRRLYLERLGKPEPADTSGLADEGGSIISLDTALNWRLDGQLVWHFSEQGYEEEIRSNIFEL